MTKNQFIKQLAAELTRYGISDAANTIDYYDELIDDRLEAGETEAEIIASLATPAQIVAQLATPDKQVRQKKMAPMLIILISILLVLGSPLWGTLLLTAIILVALGYFLIWLGPFLGAIFAAAGILGGSVSLVLSFFVGLQEGWIIAVMQLGISFVMVGVGLICAGATWYMTEYLIRFSVGITRWLVGMFRSRLKVVA
ncbi:DUF1700 domain-containing protein [Latilactobacillus curvatus]